MAYVPSASLSQGKGRLARSQGAMEPPSNIVLGRVIEIHRETYTVDVVIGHTGLPVHGIPVAASLLGTKSGEVYLPRVSSQLSTSTSIGSTGVFQEDRERTSYAVVTYIADDVTSPLVIGFVRPKTNQMLFDRDGFAIDRHESDQYSVTENGPQSTYDPAT